MIRISSGFYQGEYMGNAFQVFRVGEKGEAINGLWIWHTGTEGGEDYFPSKRVAIEAFKDWIDSQSTKGH